MNKKPYNLLLITALLTMGVVACDSNDGPAERAGEHVDRAVEKTGDQVEKAGDKIEDATDR